MFEEAHRLSKYYTNETKIATKIKKAIGKSFKLLLTATPMKNSIMDLYGLINFIDEGCLGDANEFYKRYFRKPEKYKELSGIASRYCFRTLRSQVDTYVNIPKRIPITSSFCMSIEELKLEKMINEYLEKINKLAFPKMDKYELSLMFNKAISSSVIAFSKLLESAISRVKESELINMLEFTKTINIKKTGKIIGLLKALEVAFSALKKVGANSKVVIFTESRATLWLLEKILSNKYKTYTFDGNTSFDYSIIKNFEKDGEILITTDVASEGFNLSFCSFMVNYDLPYSVLIVEQRIMRLHRQGQKNDVIILNFLNKENFADVRVLELINKRILQFDSIVGRSDDILGNFTDDANEGMISAFKQARHKKEIELDFKNTLEKYKNENKKIVSNAENVLFTTFTEDISKKVTVTPQYIKNKIEEINEDLWELIKWFFADKSGYSIEESTKTLNVEIHAQKVFTGTSLRRSQYSISDKTLNITSAITKNVIKEIFWNYYS